MIKIAFIAPTKLIAPYSTQGDFNLGLSHLMSNAASVKNIYQRALQSTGLPLILDNGLFENGKAEAVDSLIEKANRMQATTVFVPDVLYDRKGTEAVIEEVRDRFKGALKMAAVVQADNPDDYLDSYLWMCEQPEIDLIGLSILSIPKSFASLTGTDDITLNRIKCLQMLNELGKHKKSHLLGAGSSYSDVGYARAYCPWVVSHDSSSAIWNGIQGKRIDPDTLEVEGGKSRVAVDFTYDKELTAEQKSIIQSNIDVVTDVCM